MPGGTKKQRDRRWVSLSQSTGHSPVLSLSGQFVRVQCPVMVTDQPTSTNELVRSLLTYYLMPDRVKSDVMVLPEFILS